MVALCSLFVDLLKSRYSLIPFVDIPVKLFCISWAEIAILFVWGTELVKLIAIQWVYKYWNTAKLPFIPGLYHIFLVKTYCTLTLWETFTVESMWNPGSGMLLFCIVSYHCLYIFYSKIKKWLWSAKKITAVEQLVSTSTSQIANKV